MKNMLFLAVTMIFCFTVDSSYHSGDGKSCRSYTECSGFPAYCIDGKCISAATF